MGKNKTSFKKGNNANPKGRPKKGYSITEMMKEMLDSEPDLKKAIGQQIAKKALQGDQSAVRMLWNYMDGLPRESLDLTSGGKPIPLLGGVANAENDSNGKDTNADQKD